MFICCKTKPKKDNTSNAPTNVSNSETFSSKQSKVEEVNEKKSTFQDSQLKQKTTEIKCKYPEVQNMVQKIKSYRNQKKMGLSVEIEKSFVTSLIEQDQPTQFFVEFKWAIHYTNFLDGKISSVPKQIDNLKLLTEENKTKEFINITQENDPQLLPNLQPEKHYVLLNEESWTFIKMLYGGGPTIQIEIGQNIQSPEINDATTYVSNNTKATSNSSKPTQTSLDTQKNINEPFFEDMKLTSMNVEAAQMTISYVDDTIQRNQATLSSDREDREVFRTNTIKIQPKPKISYECPAIGLENPKYYCYMNSALQILFSIQILNEKMVKMSKQQDKKFLYVYQDLIRKVLGSKSGSSHLPEQLQIISQKRFKQNLQQDAHEYLLFMLTSLQEDLNGKTKYQKETFSNAEEAWDVYKARNPDIINDLFAGQITNKSYCLECKGVSEGYDPIWDLNLPLSKNNIPTQLNLDECLRSYFKEERINDQWKCDQCQLVNKVVLRRTQITQSPKILIIHLKRFSQVPKNQKINDDVTYPEILDLKEFCNEKVEKTKYQLQGVISHMGQMNGGHYVCYAQREKQWYQFDDDIVYKDKNNRHLSEKGAYILIYEQL